MTQKHAVSPTTAPAPYGGGHYSPGIVCGDFVFTSGQGPIVPGTGEVAHGSIAEQTQLTIDNLDAVLTAAGSGLDRIVKATVFLADLADWQVVNAVWAERIGGLPPARTAVQATLLAGMGVEIDVIALA
ncbi:RidA family protein [Mycobacterium sp. 21AC1]|uniref:RidA family protein n=1 Tax=[Mycobacterium] appelbergii TaxID=2939269 RepID=UPI0029394583|nr:RidA family protein [Mycobacterium sp. 21AC1]MDV3127311.1 RidA family protein [Mycobacterium sp. 21AC1]